MFVTAINKCHGIMVRSLSMAHGEAKRSVCAGMTST
jgi:hypothetical protein